jgi:hypothetical protein
VGEEHQNPVVDESRLTTVQHISVRAARNRYLYQSELFFPDSCNCDDKKTLSADINGQYDIE